MNTRPFSAGFLCGLALLCFAAPSATAQNGSFATGTSAAVLQPAKRWLLVIETSAAMQRRKEGAVEVVRNLLQSEMNGQLTPGDTIGVWTFDRELHTGKLPVQKWPGSGQASVGKAILDFITAQEFADSSVLASLIQPMNGVIGKSELLTILLVSSGQGDISGTPFDAEINEAWATWRKEKSKRPLVTVLRGVSGKLAQHYVTPADYAVELPPLPRLPEPKPLPPVAKPDATNAPPPPKPQVPQKPTATSAPPAPLFFSGPNKKDEPGITISGVRQTNVSIPPTPPALAPPQVGSEPSAAKQETIPPIAAAMPAPEPVPTVQAPPPSAKVKESQPSAAAAISTDEAKEQPVESVGEAPEGHPGNTRAWLMIGSAVVAMICLAGTVVLLIRGRGKRGPAGSIISRSYDDQSPDHRA